MQQLYYISLSTDCGTTFPPQAHILPAATLPRFSSQPVTCDLTTDITYLEQPRLSLGEVDVIGLTHAPLGINATTTAMTTAMTREASESTDEIQYANLPRDRSSGIYDSLIEKH